MTSRSIRAFGIALLGFAPACVHAPVRRLPAGPIVPGTISVLTDEGGHCKWDRVAPDGTVVAIATFAAGSCGSREVRFSSTGVAFSGAANVGTDAADVFVVEPDGSVYELPGFPLGEFLGKIGFTRAGEFGVRYTQVQGLSATLERHLSGSDVERTYVWRDGRWKGVSSDEYVGFLEDEEEGEQAPSAKPDHRPFDIIDGDLYRDGNKVWSSPSRHAARFWPGVSVAPGGSAG